VVIKTLAMGLVCLQLMRGHSQWKDRQAECRTAQTSLSSWFVRRLMLRCFSLWKGERIWSAPTSACGRCQWYRSRWS